MASKVQTKDHPKLRKKEELWKNLKISKANGRTSS